LGTSGAAFLTINQLALFLREPLLQPGENA
jgi:hypothetical protein